MVLSSPSLAADERLDLDDGRWEDVHVITGSLKLFFPELPEPLFPFSHFSQFIAAISEQLGRGKGERTGTLADPFHTLSGPHLWPFPCAELQDHAQRSRCVRDLVRTLPAPNLDTLRVLFQHLCR